MATFKFEIIGIGLPIQLQAALIQYQYGGRGGGGVVRLLNLADLSIMDDSNTLIEEESRYNFFSSKNPGN